MGTIISVDSVVYNMAGEEENRPPFLKSLIVRNVLSGTKDSISDSLQRGYLSGPAIKLKSFYRWSTDPANYGTIGLPTGELKINGVLNPTIVAPYIPHAANEEVWAQLANVGFADHLYWAEQWILENNHAAIGTGWTADYNENTNQILIQFVDTTTQTITPVDFNYNDRYVYTYYTLVVESEDGPLVLGSLVELGSAPFPDTTGWTLNYDATTPFSGDLETVTVVNTHELKVYSDSRPNEEASSSGTPVSDFAPYSFDGFTRTYTKQSTVPDPDQLIYLVETMNQSQSGSIVINHTETPVVTEVVTDEGGVTVTTTTTETTVVDQDQVLFDRSYSIDTQENIHREYSNTKLYIYKIGGGIVDLDNLVQGTTQYGEFFPFLPLRIENTFLSETYLPEAYGQVKKAYKKATGARLDDLIDQIADNASIGDIDHSYVTFGVSLNVVEKACKKYLYVFFEKMQAAQAGGPNIYDQWKIDVAAQEAVTTAWLDWKAYVSGPQSEGGSYPDEPPRPSFPSLPSNQINIKGTGTVNSHFDVRLQWLFITSGTGVGLGKVGAKTGDLWFEYLGEDDIARTVISTQSGDFLAATTNTQKVRLYWQKTPGSFTYLDIIGSVYNNYIYGGKSVRITSKEALEDPEESGFIVPLHYDTWREMSLTDTTQMATACVFVVFNCYSIYKTKWYQSGIFKILLVIVIAIFSAVFTGGAGFGLLGTYLSVGTALGFTGLTAAIVGSIANALAALILATILEQVAAELGPMGAIISALLMIVIGQVASGLNSTGTIALNWGDMLRVDNLLKLTDAVGQGVTRMFEDENIAMQLDWSDYAKKAEIESNKIQQAYFEEFGYGGGLIDPMMFVDAAAGPVAESSDTFLTRTLMTGSEIAEMSKELLYEFPEYSLKLPNAFT